LAAFEIQPVAATFGNLEQLLLPDDVQADGNRCLQILFQKLALPAAMGLKGHIHAM
jgi:hypothetical protein